MIDQRMEKIIELKNRLIETVDEINRNFINSYFLYCNELIKVTKISNDYVYYKRFAIREAEFYTSSIEFNNALKSFKFLNNEQVREEMYKVWKKFLDHYSNLFKENFGDVDAFST